MSSLRPAFQGHLGSSEPKQCDRLLTSSCSIPQTHYLFPFLYTQYCQDVSNHGPCQPFPGQTAISVENRKKNSISRVFNTPPQRNFGTTVGLRKTSVIIPLPEGENSLTIRAIRLDKVPQRDGLTDRQNW